MIELWPELTVRTLLGAVEQDISEINYHVEIDIEMVSQRSLSDIAVTSELFEIF